jgi:phage/plasmid-associated DNA primase
MGDYKIYSVIDYKIKNFEEFLIKKSVEFSDIDDICEELENDKFYHFRITKILNKKYTFFGDIDHYDNDIHCFIKILKTFLKEYYNLSVHATDIMYTENNIKTGSYHYSIPKWNLSLEKLKEIHSNLSNINKDAFIKNNGEKVVDTTIYSEHWFRCPNQSKGNDSSGAKHIIKVGNIKDFIVDYVPENSINIDDVNFIDKNNNIKKKNTIEFNNEKKIIVEKNNINEQNDDKKAININLIQKFISILSANYYNDYNDWMKVGMILKYSSKQYNFNFFELFDNFSKKSLKYKKDEVQKFWNGLKENRITITIGSLFDFAKKSNSTEYKKILKESYSIEKIEINEKYICEKLKDIAGQYFFFLNKSLYSFNNKNHLWYKDSIETIKKYISDDLYDYLFGLLNDSIDDETYLKTQIKELKKYCQINKWIEELLKTFRTRFLDENNDDIKFDLNPYLLGFNNGVYDLKQKIFRKYEFTDYITTRTGYNYKKSTEEERFVIYDLFAHIETEEDNRYLLWQILSSGIIGKCHEVFIIFDGRGGNGKSVTTRLMLEALGDYAYKGNVQTLCSKQKTGANPELANMNLKRYIIFSEPESTEKIHNSILKELTGNSRINARKLYENKCDVIIPATIVLECNDKINLKNDSTEGETRRIINYTYKSKFTKNKDEVNEEERIFLARDISDEFIQKYKLAFIDILIEKAIIFMEEDNEKFKITESVKKTTEKYISESYCFLTFLNEETEKTKKETDYISLSELFSRFKSSDYYFNSSKEERRDKLSLKKMKEFFETNKEISKNFRHLLDKIIDGNRIRGNNVIIGYKFKKEDYNDEQ